MKIIIGISHPTQTHLLPLLRQWSRQGKQEGFWRHVTSIECMQLSEGPVDLGPADILLAVGVSVAVIHSIQKLDPAQVIVVDELSQQQTSPNASLLCNTLTSIIGVVQLENALRKAVLRLQARLAMSFRLIASPSEFEQYFRLRCRVWKQQRYYTGQGNFEADYADRSSLHFGVFEGDKLHACARLVFPLGQEYYASIEKIEQVLREDTTNEAMSRFENRPRIHPFDALEVLPALNQHYRNWVVEDNVVGELSRVIVDRPRRKCGLGEVLVDSVIEYATAYSISHLFLACRKNHGRFYQRCGFARLSSITASAFFDVKASVIAMDRSLRSIEMSRPSEEVMNNG